MYATFLSILFALLSPAAPASGTPPVLAFPVACRIGQACLIQKLFDHDAGPGRRDYRCGTLTTDGHDGTDIRLRTMADMRAGYAVLASQAGTVLRTRDGEPDISIVRRADFDGKEAGNAVAIDHGGGWETQYSHLRRGSVRVRPGQRVAAGEAIGLIGLSGNSEFPHLHFTVRYKGAALDPFVGAAPVAPCRPDAAVSGLWSPAAAQGLGYVPTVAVAAGLASDVPPRTVYDRDPPPAPAGEDGALLLWVDAIGVRAGDWQEFSIVGPDGRIVHSRRSEVAEGGLSWFAYSGQRAPVGGWRKGRYIGRYMVRRGPEVVAQIEAGGRIM